MKEKRLKAVQRAKKGSLRNKIKAKSLPKIKISLKKRAKRSKGPKSPLKSNNPKAIKSKKANKKPKTKSPHKESNFKIKKRATAKNHKTEFKALSRLKTIKNKIMRIRAGGYG